MKNNLFDFFFPNTTFKECFIINFIQAHIFFSYFPFLFFFFFLFSLLFCHFITDGKKCGGEGKEQRKTKICGQLKEEEKRSL